VVIYILSERKEKKRKEKNREVNYAIVSC
jgi:hypothetical protein